MIAQRAGLKRKKREKNVSNLLFMCFDNVCIVVQIDGRLLCGVYDICNGPILDHEAIMFAAVGLEEARFAIGRVARDMSYDLPQSRSGKAVHIVLWCQWFH